MRFLLSPSKTMEPTISCKGQSILFPQMKDTVLAYLKQFTLDDLSAYYGVKRALARLNYERLHDFKEVHIALYAYTGQQFKYLDAPSLSERHAQYLNDHLLILSGMYGAVRPFDCIGLYRLPMGLKMNDTKLSILWRERLVPHFKGETLINLASKEYADALKGLPLITVDFLVPNKKGGLKRAPAMEAKKLRGLFVRAATVKHIVSPELLKSITLNGYAYDAARSDVKTFTFTKTNNQ